MYLDSDGNFAIAIAGFVIGLSALIKIAIVLIATVTVVTVLADPGVQWHINNTMNNIRDLIHNSWNHQPTSNNQINNKTVDEEFEIHGIMSGLLGIQVQFSKAKPKYKRKQNSAKVKAKSKKDAYEKAKKRGGGREPIHHKAGYDRKGIWRKRHYHPGLPEGHPHKHDHYYYSILLIFKWFEEMINNEE